MKRTSDKTPANSKKAKSKRPLHDSEIHKLVNQNQSQDAEVFDEQVVIQLQSIYEPSSIMNSTTTSRRSSSPDMFAQTDEEDDGCDEILESTVTQMNSKSKRINKIQSDESSSSSDSESVSSIPVLNVNSSDEEEEEEITTNLEHSSHRAGRYKDSIWKRFTVTQKIVKDKTTTIAVCKYCHKKVSAKAKRLKEHKCNNKNSNNITGKVFAPASASAATASKTLPSSKLQQKTTTPKQQDIRKHLDFLQPSNKYDLDKKVGRLIFGSNLPFRFVENKEFIEYSRALKPSYVLPKRRLIGGKILDDVYDDILKIIAEELKGKNVIIMQDGWSTNQNSPVVSHCLSTGEKTYFFNAVATESNKKDAPYCYALLEDAIKEAEKLFECKIIGFVTDNCNTMKSLREKVSENNPELITYGCNTHMMNNLGVVLSPGTLLDNITEVNSFFRNHHYESSRLLQLHGTRPILPVVTRWTSQCESIKSYLKNQTKFLEISREPKSTLKPIKDKPANDGASTSRASSNKKPTATEKAAAILKIIQNTSVYDEANKLLTVLQPIAIALDKLQAENATVADAVSEWIKIENSLYRNSIFDKFKKDWRPLYMNPTNLAAYCLHPKFRGKDLSNDDTNKAHDWLDSQHRSLGLAAIRLSILDNTYFPPHMLKEDTINSLSSAKWWEFIGTRSIFPQAATDLVLKLMILPASTSGLERCFSTLGNILTKKRNRLGLIKAKKLCTIYRTLCTKSNDESDDDDDDQEF